MTDITFAIAHMGEYFQLDGSKVRVIGYDATGDGDCIIVDDEEGWNIEYADSTDVIVIPSRTGRCTYTNWEELR
nr:MAG TPA: hypothetical protein [Caudoviricetes sp.]